jgi:glycosyltransferase involved in cell wall biosynthesis
MTYPEGSKVIVLIPAYNEELTIGSMVLLAKHYAEKVVVVDDGSKDRTVSIAIESGADVLKIENNSGKAKALLEGCDYCRRFDPDVLVMIDGDGQMDPALIPSVAKPIIDEKADLVIGSRYLQPDVKIPFKRKVGQKILNSATNMGSAGHITDSQSGYRALSRKALANMDFISDAYNIESDMIVHFAEKGLIIFEVPISVRYDVPNGHKQNAWKHGIDVLSRIIGYVGYRRPLLLFGVPGIVLMLLGLVLSFATYIETIIFFHWTLITQGLAGLSSLGIGLFLIFASLMLNSLGILMERKKNQ